MCLNPITIKVDKSVYNDNYRCVQVPCGKCAICLQKYQNSWTIRIMEELKTRPNNCFFTLTYRNETLPHVLNSNTGEVRSVVLKKHIQDWLKRYRSRYFRKNRKRADFKYFICSELGPRTLRPHYHGLFFGLSVEDCKSLFDEWREMFGFVVARPVNAFSLEEIYYTGRYVGKYCNKGLFETPTLSDEEFPLPPMFRLISKGIGVSYVDKLREYHLCYSHSGDRISEIVQRKNYKLKNINYALPRYYQDKIYGQKSLLRTKIANYILARNDDFYNRQCQQLQSEMSEIEASRLIYSQEAELLSERASEITDKYSSFLNKSKL